MFALLVWSVFSREHGKPLRCLSRDVAGTETVPSIPPYDRDSLRAMLYNWHIGSVFMYTAIFKCILGISYV